jgi:hypothetical protein
LRIENQKFQEPESGNRWRGLTLAALIALGQRLQLSVADRGQLYCYGFEPSLCVRFRAGLFARFERQGFSEPNRDSAQEPVYVIDPADMTRAHESRHMEGISGPEAWDTEASG